MSVLQTALPGKTWHPSWPIRIVAFSSSREYAPYAVPAARAYHLRLPTRDYIVISRLDSNDLSIATHEYVHVMVSQSGAELPLWLNEGLATLYSTLRFTGHMVNIGEPTSGLLQTFRNSTIDLDRLTSTTRSSIFYTREPDKGVFYSQSWAFVHMLSLSAAFPPDRLSWCIQMLASGSTHSEAFQAAYGRTLSQIGSVLRLYGTSTDLRSRSLETTLRDSSAPMHARPVSQLEPGLALGELLVALGRKGEAERHYVALDKENPNSGEPLVALGRIAFERGSYKEATHYLVRAKKLGAQGSVLETLLLRSERAGEYEDQRLALEHAVDAKEKTAGKDDLGLAESLKRLAEFHVANDGFAEAESYYRRALGIEEGACGVQSPVPAKTRHQLGLLNYRQKRYDEAEACFLRSLAAVANRPDGDLAWTLRVLTDLGLVYAIQNRDLEAEAVLSRVLSLRTETLGRDHIDTILSMEHLARVLQKLSRSEEAESINKRCFAVRCERVNELSISIPGADGRHPPREAVLTFASPGITKPRPIVMPLPLYPDEGRKAGVEGLILLAGVVGTDGRVYDLELLRGLGFGLDEGAAETLLAKWRFVPAQLEGKSVPVRCNFEVSFKVY